MNFTIKIDSNFIPVVSATSFLKSKNIYHLGFRLRILRININIHVICK